MITIKELSIDTESAGKIIDLIKKNEPEIWNVLKDELKQAFSLQSVGCSLKEKHTITFEDWVESKGFIHYEFNKYINEDKDIWDKKDLEKMYNRLTKL
mgnify:FL=1